MRKLLLVAFFFSLVVSVSLLNARSNSRANEVAPLYRFTDLTLATGNNGNLVSADTINNKGEIAGHVFIGDNVNMFLWSNGKTRILGKLPGSTSCAASDINDKGEVVGTCSFPYGENGRGSLWPPSKHFLWKNGKMQNLSGSSSFALTGIKINNRSQVIMGALWENGRIKSLGNWIPTAINDKGQIAGARFTQKKKSGYPDRIWAVIWENGVETNVANHRSSVMFLNNNRNMVIEEDDGSSEIADDRQYLIKDGTKTTLSSGKDIAHLRAMNDRCQIVGYKNGKGAAALWQNGKWYNLSDLIPAQAGWDLEVAKDISERGQIIGVGKLNGKTRAFLLTPISQPVKPKP